MKLLTCALIIAGLAANTDLYARPLVTINSGPKQVNGMQFCARVEDTLTMIVSNDRKVVAKHYFCASSGPISTTAQVVTDRAGNNYILLNYGEGHGTNAVRKYLKIYALPKDLTKLSQGMYDYLRTPISAAAGLTSGWVYRYQIEKLSCGGLRLLLALSIDGPKQKVWTEPAQKTRIIDVNVPQGCVR